MDADCNGDRMPYPVPNRGSTMLTFDQALKNLKLVRREIRRINRSSRSGGSAAFSPTTAAALDEVMAMFEMPPMPKKIAPTP